MDLDANLPGILRDLEYALSDLPQSELKAFQGEWELVTDYLKSDGQDLGVLVDFLLKAITSSSTLVFHGFQSVLSDSSTRYSPNTTKTIKSGLKGIPPVHNEVVRIGDKIKSLIK